MSKIVQKWRKAVKGCGKSPRENLIDNDFLQPYLSTEEFNFEKKDNFDQQNENKVFNDQEKMPIYHDPIYDILQHQTLPKRLKNNKNNSNLKESTNTTIARGFKRVFSSKPVDKYNSSDKENVDENNNFNYLELLSSKKTKENQASAKEQKSNFFGIKSQYTSENVTESDEIYYCEIPDSSNIFADNQPLIDLKCNETKLNSTTSKIKSSDSKINLFTKFDGEEQLNDEKNANNKDNQIPNSQSLNELRELGTFVSPNEAFHWYLNLIFDTKSKCIKNDKNLNENDRNKRLNICTAHLLYARNFYEMRISNSPQLKAQLQNVHPCLIALACLLDSDAVRIVDSHSCTCDSYVYLFSTRLKFCAWKSKLYIILKRPKRSSIDRLTLIEDLTNCHKIIQEKI